MLDDIRFAMAREWLGLFADLATCLTVVSVLIAVIVLSKNRATKRTIRVDFSAKKFGLVQNSLCLIADIDILNFTDREFFVVSIFLRVKGETFIMQKKELIGNGFIDYVPMKNIPICSHGAVTLSPVFFIGNVPQSGKATLEVQTTERNFVYSVNLRANDQTE